MLEELVNVNRILLLNSSPRRFGSTKKLLYAAENGALDAGCETRMQDLYDYEIKPCIGCVSDDVMACRFPCVIKDDFNRLGEIILESNGFIIGSPIYWYGPSGILKNLVDRLTSMENMIYHVGYSLLDGKTVGFIAAGNDTGAITLIAYLMSVFNSMGCLIPPWALAYHHSIENPLENNSAILDAYNVGYNVCVSSKTDYAIKRKWYTLDVDIDKLKSSVIKKIGVGEREEMEHRKKRIGLK